MIAGAGAQPQSHAPTELDLTIRPEEVEQSAGLSRPEERPYDPAPDRERKRGLIALILVTALCGIIVLAFGYIFVAHAAGGDIDALKTVLEIVFAPIVGLVGAVTGFYFGEKSR